MCATLRQGSHFAQFTSSSSFLLPSVRELKRWRRFVSSSDRGPSDWDSVTSSPGILAWRRQTTCASRRRGTSPPLTDQLLVILGFDMHVRVWWRCVCLGAILFIPVQIWIWFVFWLHSILGLRYARVWFGVSSAICGHLGFQLCHDYLFLAGNMGFSREDPIYTWALLGGIDLHPISFLFQGFRSV